MPAAVRVRGADTSQDSFVRCRTYNHAWEEFYPDLMDPPAFGWRLSLRCIRCSTERHDTISYATGQLMNRRYIYPDGYKMARDETPTREVFREELFSKLRGQLEAHAALGPGSPNGVTRQSPRTNKAPGRKAPARKTTKRSTKVPA